MRAVAILFFTLLFTNFVMSSAYGAGQFNLNNKTDFVFFGYLGFSDSDSTDIEYTDYTVSCTTLSNNQPECSSNATEQGYFHLSCAGFLNQNILCSVSNSVKNIKLPIFFDVDNFGKTQIIKPAKKLFTPIGVDLQNSTAFAGEIPEDNKPVEN